MGRTGRFLVGLFLLAALVASFTGTVLAQNDPLTLDEYWETIGDIHDALSNSGDEVFSLRQTAAARLETITAVALPDGRIQSIDHTFLIRQLQNENNATDTLVRLFIAYTSGRFGWPDPAFPRLDEASLAEILAQPEFQYLPEEQNFLQRLWQDVRQEIEDFFLRLFPEESVLRLPFTELILAAAVMLVLVALAFGLRGMLADFSAEAAVGPGDDFNGEPLTAELALQRAQELSTSGDYRTAVRYLYLSALLLLEDRGLLRYDRSLTNREYVRTVAHRPELAAILREVIDVFDRVWYGFQTLKPAEYDQYASRVEALKQQRDAR